MTELRLGVLEVRQVLPVPAQICVVGCLEQLRAGLSERRLHEFAKQRPAARERGSAEACNLLDGRNRRLELEAAELVAADFAGDCSAVAFDPARVEHELCFVPGRERASRRVLEHLVAEAA